METVYIYGDTLYTYMVYIISKTNIGGMEMKRWLKRAIPFCLALLMVVPAYAVDYGQQTTGERTYQQIFSDVPETHWAFQFIAELNERKAISGYPDGRFYPKNTVRR